MSNKVAKTTIYDLMQNLLQKSAAEGTWRILSGPSGLGLSFAAKSFVKRTPGRCTYIKAPTDKSFDYITKQFANAGWINADGVRQVDLFASRKPEAQADDGYHLFVIDQVECFTTSLQLERLVDALTGLKGPRPFSVVMIGEARLALPTSSFARLPERTVMSHRLQDILEPFIFEAEALERADILLMADLYGASESTREAIARLCLTGLLRPSFPLFKKAVRCFNRLSNPGELSIPQLCKKLDPGWSLHDKRNQEVQTLSRIMS